MWKRYALAALMGVSLVACSNQATDDTGFAAKFSLTDESPIELCEEIRQQLDATTEPFENGVAFSSERQLGTGIQLINGIPDADPGLLDVWSEFFQQARSGEDITALLNLSDGTCITEFDRVSTALLLSARKFDVTAEQRDQMVSAVKQKAQNIYDRIPTPLAALLKIRLHENTLAVQGVDVVPSAFQTLKDDVEMERKQLLAMVSQSALNTNTSIEDYSQEALDTLQKGLELEYLTARSWMGRASALDDGL